jgi:hypothetical protein
MSSLISVNLSGIDCRIIYAINFDSVIQIRVFIDCFFSSLILVDLQFILYWLRCPFTVADEFDRYFSTACSVNPDHDVKLPFLIAAIHVDLTGLKHAACR